MAGRSPGTAMSRAAPGWARREVAFVELFHLGASDDGELLAIKCRAIVKRGASERVVDFQVRGPRVPFTSGTLFKVASH
eukprot:11005187-Alexandrium_andersonii.AAC.1